METVTWNTRDPYLVFNTRKIECWSKVRNELNGLRPNAEKMRVGKGDVFFTTPNDLASMPRSFPVGYWRIDSVIAHGDKEKDAYLYPFFIGTNAFQYLDVWSLDSRGFYVAKTGKRIKDVAYGAHFSVSDWTQGCIRIADINDLLYMVPIVQEELRYGRTIPFVVS
jgi:hypothetical protein